MLAIHRHSTSKADRTMHIHIFHIIIISFNVFHRTFASETSQFLAPYEVSQKSRNVGAVNSPTSPQSMGGSFSSEHSVMMAQHSLPPVSTTMTRPTTLAPSLSQIQLQQHNGEFVDVNNSGVAGHNQPSTVDEQVSAIRNEVTKWNPFEDPTPFSQMTEDHIFEAEFDAIRQSSKF